MSVCFHSDETKNEKKCNLLSRKSSDCFFAKTENRSEAADRNDQKSCEFKYLISDMWKYINKPLIPLNHIFIQSSDKHELFI